MNILDQYIEELGINNDTLLVSKNVFKNNFKGSNKSLSNKRGKIRFYKGIKILLSA